MTKRVLVILADGFEEIEAITPIDVLRRAGAEVTVAGLNHERPTGSHDISIQADALLESAHQELFDAVILPGGMPGSIHLGTSPLVRDLCLRHGENQRIVAAICAAPAKALGPFGLLDGRQATGFPATEGEFPASARYDSKSSTVVDEHIITSRGAGTAMDFSLHIVEELYGTEHAEALSKQMQYAL